jgi:hypothetical protein
MVSRLEVAVRFLRTELSDGAVPSSKLFDAAREAGIAEKTLRRALKSLGARRSKGHGLRAGWYWELPSRGGQVRRDLDKWPWLAKLARCRQCESGVTFHRSYRCSRCLRAQRRVV